MGDSFKESFLGRSLHESEHEGKTDFEALRGSLLRITDAWRSKQQRGQRSKSRESEDNRAPWRRELGESLESTPTHIFIVTLLLIDLLATAVDILKTIHNKTHDLDSCTTLLEGCQCVSHFEKSESWEVVYWISISILSVLTFNILLLLVASGWKFFQHPGYVLDAFVVGTALLLEIFLDTDTVGLLIILTLWRIVRVAHGIFEVTDEAWEKEIKQFEQRLKEAELSHERDQELLRRKDERIAELERTARDRGGQLQQDSYDYGEQQQDGYDYGGQLQEDDFDQEKH